MKIYEALKEMIKNKKTIKDGDGNDRAIYKRITVDDDDIILYKWGRSNEWNVGHLLLDVERLNSDKWEIYEERKEKK